MIESGFIGMVFNNFCIFRISGYCSFVKIHLLVRVFGISGFMGMIFRKFSRFKGIPFRIFSRFMGGTFTILMAQLLILEITKGHLRGGT